MFSARARKTADPGAGALPLPISEFGLNRDEWPNVNPQDITALAHTSTFGSTQPWPAAGQDDLSVVFGCSWELLDFSVPILMF